ncbi:MAG: BREX system serine/threonine kinase PglW, partial [Actinomycetota bacterium]
MASESNWVTVSESRFPWEREALEFIRERFPQQEPYRAWANFEFIAEDGSVNEVDLLVFTPQGFFLIEIKSSPGRLHGDAGAWTWERDGRFKTVDNPLLAANAKARKLRSLLERQTACRGRNTVPFLDALVFCSDPKLDVQLAEWHRLRICFRDTEAPSGLPGVLAAITRRQCPGLEGNLRGTFDRPTARALSQALAQAGVRPSQRHRKVSDYELEELIGSGPGYQDWQAKHVRVPDSHRRIRLYQVRARASAEERAIIERAALREFQLMQRLDHAGILRANHFTEHELGPALFFEHEPQTLRLDHFLAQGGEKLSLDTQLDLLRQIAEAVRFAHDRGVVHRALGSQSILIVNPESARPRAKLYNWQVGYRGGEEAVSQVVTPTSHADRLVEAAATAYMAPEALAHETYTGEHLDVFSLGALAYHLFSGKAPAANIAELAEKLRGTDGLQISSVMNGAGERLQFLIQFSTHPLVPNRLDSATEFLAYLDEVEEELTTPDQDVVEDPTRANRGDRLPGGFQVLRRLGQGATAMAFLVEKDGTDSILKVANDREHNRRLEEEAAVVQKLRHPHIVAFQAKVQVADRQGFLTEPVFVRREDRTIETLGRRLREEGPLSLDFLQRFGEDLLGGVNFLEDQGISHRDLKPDNIALGQVGSGDRLHLVLFDFSLSRTPADNIRAGTPGYLDPFLSLRKRWDLHAERYAAAMTLYQMAVGIQEEARPVWGDGRSDPAQLTAEVTLDPERFDATVREPLTAFFQRAFRRDAAARFDNAEEMLHAWRHCFGSLQPAAPDSLHEDGAAQDERLETANFETSIAALGLSSRAANALDRANVLNVRELLLRPSGKLFHLRGVGHKTRREILEAVRRLRDRLGTPSQPGGVLPGDEVGPEVVGAGPVSVDLLLPRVLSPSGKEEQASRRALEMLLSLHGSGNEPWPSQA